MILNNRYEKGITTKFYGFVFTALLVFTLPSSIHAHELKPIDPHTQHKMAMSMTGEDDPHAQHKMAAAAAAKMAMGAYTPNFEDHPEMVLIGGDSKSEWYRLYGFPAPEAIESKVRELLSKHSS